MNCSSCLLLLVILTTFILLETSSCSNSSTNNQSASSKNLSKSDPNCDLAILTIPDYVAQIDSARYLEYIYRVVSPSGYDITNPKVNVFTIPIQNIDSLVRWESQRKILPNGDRTDSSWVMLALEPNTQTQTQTITSYFACYSGLEGGKKGPIVYFNLHSPGKIISIEPKIAIQNINAMKAYIDKLQKNKPFYPYGFQIPWDDLRGIACSIKDAPSDNTTIHGILVINAKDTVDYYIHSFNQQKGKDLDEGYGGFYDFVYPCPNSCIP